jgi:nitrogen fixation-related uncharacterized protein
MFKRSPSALMLISLSVVLTCVVVFAVLWVGQTVRSYEQRLDHMNQDIASEKERIRVLKAEWARLNTPERLEFLRSEQTRSEGAGYDVSREVSAPIMEVVPVRKPAHTMHPAMGGQNE